MLRSRLFIFFLLVFALCSCHSNNKYRYAISDFPARLQPQLIKIVNQGVTSFDYSLSDLASDRDLMHLRHAEHPLLRAAAFMMIFERKTFNNFELVADHLDDTAVVLVDNGEFGFSHQTVSDFVLYHARWKTKEDRDKMVELVLSKHNYLSAAYLVQVVLPPQEKYYTIIKDMATRPVKLLPLEGYETEFQKVEQALYGLAKFKKKEDVQIIKEKMSDFIRQLSGQSFRLMKEFPDTAYYDVFQQYHQKEFYTLSGNSPYGFSGGPVDLADRSDFIDALVAQQTDKSAALLDSVLTFFPKMNCIRNPEYVIDHLVDEVWKHPCPAYAKLREKIRSKVRHHEPLDLGPPDETLLEESEQEEKVYRWYPW